MNIAVFLCVSGLEKDGKIVFAVQDSNLFNDMLVNVNYRHIGFTTLANLGVFDGNF